MSILQSLLLEDCMSAIIDYRGKTPRKTASGIPLITARIVKDGRIEKPTEFIDPLEYDTWMSRGLPQVGDVLMTTEAPLGEIAQITDDRVALAQRLILLRGKPEVLDNTYLKYLMMSVDIQSQLHGRSSGTTVVGIKQSELRKIALSLPTITDQRAIAAVLGALDEKIEQNRRTSLALERLARAIFRAWFVDFEPVKNKATDIADFPSMRPDIFATLPNTFVDSELGLIPKEWKIGTLGDIASERREVVQPSDIDPMTPYIGLEHMPRRSIALHEWEHAGKVTSGKFRFQAGQILFGKLRPYFHKVGVAPIDGICSTDIVVMEPKSPAWFGLAIFHVSSDEFVAYTQSGSTGTKMPRTNWGDIARYVIPLPPEPVANSFTNIVAPMIEVIVKGIFENHKLAGLREYLLPRLLSGQVRVEVNHG